ncbi:hypothetical protein Peur_043383 [Populus x canadensis]
MRFPSSCNHKPAAAHPPLYFPSNPYFFFFLESLARRPCVTSMIMPVISLLHK